MAKELAHWRGINGYDPLRTFGVAYRGQCYWCNTALGVRLPHELVMSLDKTKSPVYVWCPNCQNETPVTGEILT